MSSPTPPAYKTRNCPSYNEALKRRSSLTIWFNPAMTWQAAPTGQRGRQPDYSDAATQTCLMMKVLFGIALRQSEPARRAPIAAPSVRARWATVQARWQTASSRARLAPDRAGVGCARLQHAVAAPQDAEGQHPLALVKAYGITLVNPGRHSRVNSDAGRTFIDWTVSEPGQSAIASFTVDGEQLFFPDTN